ncbi:MAG: hypothetical protein VX589_20220 [Myxococcota bacterium]|nr:hypothetical protein [Myxococcota bacterium]
MHEDTVDRASQGTLRTLFIRHRKGLMVVGLLWFGLVLSGGIFLSTLDARSGLHIFGSTIWRSGETSVLRVSLRDLQLGRSRHLGEVRGVFVNAQGQTHHSFVLKEQVGLYRQGNVAAPNTPGDYQIQLTAMDLDVPMTASFSVLVQANTPQPSTLQLIDAPKPNPRNEGTTTLSLRALDGVLANGLPDSLVLTALPNHGTITDVSIKLNVGHSSIPLPQKLELAAGGLARIPIQTAHPFFEFELSAQGSRSFATLKPIATQFTVHATSPVFSADHITLKIRSLHREGPVFIDIWHGDHWITTRAAQLDNYRAEVKLPRPPSDLPAKIVWVRAYKNAYMPGTARGGRHFVVSDTIKDGLLSLEKQFEGTVSGDRTMLSQIMTSTLDPPGKIRLLLGQLAWPEIEPPLLLDSGRTHLQTVAALKEKWQARFAYTLAGTGLLLIMGLALLVVVHRRELEQRWAEAGGTDDGASASRARIGWEVGYIFLILALFIIGMIQLMLWIRW